jgi:hypothetical protein
MLTSKGAAGVTGPVHRAPEHVVGAPVVPIGIALVLGVDDS